MRSALDNNVQSNETRLQLGWAPHTLFQVHNPIAAELQYSEHCYREHFASVPLELMLVHATKRKFCERDLVISNRHILYCIVTL